MENKSERINMLGMEALIANTTMTGTTVAIEMIGLDIMFLLEFENLVPGKWR